MKPGRNHYLPTKRNGRHPRRHQKAHSGTRNSNRAPSPGVPVSPMAMPVIARISLEKNNPNPVLA